MSYQIHEIGDRMLLIIYLTCVKCPVGSPHTDDRKGLSSDSNFIKLNDTIEIIL